MKVVVAPDSYKGSLTATEVAEAMVAGIRLVDQRIEVISAPMADGGEGTVDSLVNATNGKKIEILAMDPLGREITAVYGVLGDKQTCVIETAAASGLSLLNESERNPLYSTSYGTGQLILNALNRGYRKFIIGLGGSATNDAGAGILQALGIKLLDKNGQELGKGGYYLGEVTDIDASAFDSRIAESEFIIANDVENPLIGPKGSSAIFGPQKGATEEMVQTLDSNLTHFADIIKNKTNISIHHLAGAGAAGGIGGALFAFFNGKMQSGIDIVIQASNLERKVMDADLVITGEGQMDYQTAYGKAPAGVAKVAKNFQVPVLAIVGSIGAGIENLREIGIQSVLSIINRPMSSKDAFEEAKKLITYTTEQGIRIYLMNKF